MIKNQFFKKHYSRLRLEAIIRSALWGLFIGFAANFVAAVFAWILDFGGIWFGIAIGAGVALVSGILFYFLKFKPDVKETARRIDRLGLDERMITMLELEGDDSYIATAQRENARLHLEGVANRKLKLRFSRALISMAVVTALLAASMTTVVALAENNVIPAGPDVINPDDPLASYIAVSYVADEGGFIEGESDQLIEPGADAEPVIAVPDDGWMFVGWDDELANPERHDKGITEELLFTAIFEQIEDGDDGGEGDGGADGPGSEEQEGDRADDQPSEEGSQSNGSQSGDQSDKEAGEEGSEGENDNNQNNKDQGEGSSDDGSGEGAGGKWNQNNMFFDGQTYYRDFLEEFYEVGEDLFGENGEIPPEFREFFESYLGSI